MQISFYFTSLIKINESRHGDKNCTNEMNFLCTNKEKKKKIFVLKEVSLKRF